MKMLSLVAVVVALGLSLPMADAEAAKRLGGGSSTGMQRQMNTTPAKAPTAAPAQPAAAAPAAAAAGAAAAAPARSKWMGPLAGLAAGLGLAALASHFGFGEGLANMMMIGLLVMAVLMVVGFIMRKRMGAQSPAMAGAGAGAGSAPLQYSGNNEPQGVPASRPYDPATPGASASLGAAPAAAVAATDAPRIPADFDAPAFARNAKVNFIRLQAANDAGNLEDIRDFTTPEMFAEISVSINERGGVKQHTDVVSINADVLEVVEEANRYVVSVRFTGTVREDGANAEPVDEIWHLTKLRTGSTGWLLAGIQQAQ